MQADRANFCQDCGKVIQSRECSCGWKMPHVHESKSQHEIFRDQLADKFRTLPGTFKQLIREAEAEGIHWRGDDQAFFQKVIQEHRRMKGVGIDVYRKEAAQVLRRAIAGARMGGNG